MRGIDINEIRNMQGEYNKILEESEETFEKHTSNIVKNNKEANSEMMKEASTRAEYEKLLEKQRTTGLSKFEKEKLKLLKDNVKHYNDLRDQEFESLKSQLKLKEISEEEYYTKLSELRDTYFEEGTAEWAKYSIEISKYNIKLLDEQKKSLIEHFSDINKEYDKSLDKIIQKQENLKEKLTSISDIYYKVSVSGAKKGETYSWLQLSNIDVEIEALKNYSKAIEGMKERTDKIFEDMDLSPDKLSKVKAEFFEQFSDLDIGEATGFSNYLMNISHEKLSTYLTKWVEKIDLAELISKNAYSDEASDLITNYSREISQGFSSELAESLSNIPDSFFQNGALSAEQFKNGFLDAIDKVLADLSFELNKKVKTLIPGISQNQSPNIVNNNSSYNIYETTSPAQTAIEIYKQEVMKRMLVGDE